MDTSSKVLHQWKNMALIEKEVLFPNDEKVIHTVVKHPGAAVIIPIDVNGDLVMIKQFRPAINDWIIEFAAGTIEEGEELLACAERELAEECGLAAKKWQYIGNIVASPGFCDEMMHCYLCSELMPADAEMDEDEVIETFSMSPEEFEHAVVSQEISDAKTIAAYFKAKMMLSIEQDEE